MLKGPCPVNNFQKKGWILLNYLREWFQVSTAGGRGASGRSQTDRSTFWQTSIEHLSVCQLNIYVWLL